MLYVITHYHLLYSNEQAKQPHIYPDSLQKGKFSLRSLQLGVGQNGNPNKMVLDATPPAKSGVFGELENDRKKKGSKKDGVNSSNSKGSADSNKASVQSQRKSYPRTAVAWGTMRQFERFWMS